MWAQMDTKVRHAFNVLPSVLTNTGSPAPTTHLDAVQQAGCQSSPFSGDLLCDARTSTRHELTAVLSLGSMFDGEGQIRERAWVMY